MSESNESQNRTFVLTPKGKLATVLLEYGLSMADADNIWNAWQGFCMRQLREEYPDGEYAAVVLDGEGGQIIPASQEHT